MSENKMIRFIKMYDEYYTQVEKELQNGRKESHWMWFIFPQITGLGHSPTAKFYAIQNMEEANMFLESPCGEKLQKLLQILLSLNENDPESIFGCIDAMKLKSSMTLFAAANPTNPIFDRILTKFYHGQKDEKTLEILRKQQRVCSYMTPQEFLKEFIPAYDHGDIGTLHEIRRNIFADTMQIVKKGTYTAENGAQVSLPDPAAMMINSKMYRSVEKANLPELPQQTIVEVLDSDSLLAGKTLLEEGYHPAVLNFANRQTAGGGVLHGSGAQEENMFRRSDLAFSLYQFHPNGINFEIPQREERYPMDRTTGGAYSPDVTVFRGTEFEGYPLLQMPYQLGVVTVAAMNRPELKNPYEIADHLVEPILEKIRTIFRITLNHGHDAIVLGAWGCGAFKNPPQHIAKMFHQIMDEAEFRNRFKKIVFAIIDRRNIDIGHTKIGNFLPFQEEFSISKQNIMTK